MNIFWIVMLLPSLLMIACSHQVAKHSHVVIVERQLNIWSYSPIETVQVNGITLEHTGYVEVVIKGQNAFILLKNGSSVSVSNHVTINGVSIPTDTVNVLIRETGKVEINSYISTFR